MDSASYITPDFIADYFKIESEEATEIYSRLERVVYHNGEEIVHVGDAADGLYFIEEGMATVLNKEGEPVNEMEPGQYFGEYAILADAPRMTTVKAHGQVIAYRMDSEDFLSVVAKHPKITGKLLRQVYDQVSVKHTKLNLFKRKNRGILSVRTSRKDTSVPVLVITYGLTLAVFLLVAVMGPRLDTIPLWWQLLPIVFLMAFTVGTKRILEGMLLTVLLCGGMLGHGNFFFGFRDIMTEGIGNTDTAETILIMAMIECVATLLAGVGVVTAFKKIANKYLKSGRRTLFGMIGILLLVSIDECLNVVTGAFCLNELTDKHRIPREETALMGSCSTALCSLIPFSLWGGYICGWISLYFDDKGGVVFLKTIPLNLAGVVALIAVLLLAAGKLPKTKQMAQAISRVKEGGSLWPEGSERYFETEGDDGIVGRPINLIIPIGVLAVSSIVCGTLQNEGHFALDTVTGLVITLVVMFVMYISQRIMSPREYMDRIADGISNALVPILLLILSERISGCLDQLGFADILEAFIPKMVGGQMFLVPACIFVLFSIIGLLLGSSWGMYGLGIPIAVQMANVSGLNVALCLGAVLAAGIVGECLCPFLDETSPVVTAIGCGPKAYRKLRVSYWLIFSVIITAGYVGLGFLFQQLAI